MGNKPACDAKCRETYSLLYDFIDAGDIVFPDAPGDEQHCFRVKIARSNYSISISIPPDASGNREGCPTTIETALFKNGEIFHNDSWGYGDIRRFGHFKEVGREILRVRDLVLH